MAPKSHHHHHHRRATKPRRHAKATAKLVNPGRNGLGNVSRPPLMARERAQIRRVRVSKWKVRNLRAERLSGSEEGDEGDEDKENMEVEEDVEVGESEDDEEESEDDEEESEEDSEESEDDEDDEDGMEDEGDKQTEPRAEETTTTHTTFEEGRRVNVNDLPWINGFPGNYTFTEVFENGELVGYMARLRDT